jgi:hypothetical protein
MAEKESKLKSHTSSKSRINAQDAKGYVVDAEGERQGQKQRSQVGCKDLGGFLQSLLRRRTARLPLLNRNKSRRRLAHFGEPSERRTRDGFKSRL